MKSVTNNIAGLVPGAPGANLGIQVYATLKTALAGFVFNHKVEYFLSPDIYIPNWADLTPDEKAVDIARRAFESKDVADFLSGKKDYAVPISRFVSANVPTDFEIIRVCL